MFINENVIWWIMTEKMKSCTRYFHKLVRFIQKRMSNKIRTVESKADVLKVLWVNHMHKFEGRAAATKDEGMKLMINAIKEVPVEIRDYLLKQFIK